MRFLTLAASLIKPWNKFLPGPIHIRHDPQYLVPLTLEPHYREKIFFNALLHPRQLRLLQLLTGCKVPVRRPILAVPYLVGNKTHLRPLTPRFLHLPVDLTIKRPPVLLRYLRNSLAKLLRHISAYRKLNPSKALIILKVTVPHKVMLISR